MSNLIGLVTENGDILSKYEYKEIVPESTIETDINILDSNEFKIFIKGLDPKLRILLSHNLIDQLIYSVPRGLFDDTIVVKFKSPYFNYSSSTLKDGMEYKFSIKKSLPNDSFIIIQSDQKCYRFNLIL